MLPIGVSAYVALSHPPAIKDHAVELLAVGNGAFVHYVPDPLRFWRVNHGDKRPKCNLSYRYLARL